MQHITNLKWLSPLAAGRIISRQYPDCVVLHSSLINDETGKYSIIAFDKTKEADNSSFERFAEQLSEDASAYENSWFGYLGYGLKNQFETLPKDSPSWINFPDIWMAQYCSILIFDHTEQTVSLFGEDNQLDVSALLTEVNATAPAKATPHATHVASNMSNTTYFANVEKILEHIRAGDIYQANLTRKFYGTLHTAPDYFSLFEQLCDLSPAPYSAYLQMGDKVILSSSPERFLHISPEGKVDTRPIKGSAKRFPDNKEQDTLSRNALIESEKDKAENLMIVDLCRNDLSRGCEIGSVKVEQLFQIKSYATIHHMVSTVVGQKASHISTAEMVRDCFPPGSMTGTPKIKAMEICSELEQQSRGVYSGSIGWFGGDGSADLSVVIRTILFEGNKFEFQVGGAIVIDSDPYLEQQETFTKATALCQLLGITKEQLERL